MLALKRKRQAQARAAAALSASPESLVDHVQPKQKKRTPAEIRIQKDLSLLEPDDSVSIIFNNPDDLTEFTLAVTPSTGPWNGGVYQFNFSIQQDYPFSPPKVVCATKLYHPNVSFYDGKVCLGMRDWWRPINDVSTVIHGLCDIFRNPVVDIPVNAQAADLLKENEEQFRRVVTWTRRRTNDAKPASQDAEIGHSVLDVLPPEMMRITTDYLDEESLVKFFIASLSSVPHQYIYANMARTLVRERFALFQNLLRRPLATVLPRRSTTRVSPVVPPAVVTFVEEYANNIAAEDEANHVAGVLSVAGEDNRSALDNEEEAYEMEAIMDLQRIVQVIRCLSGRLAVLHYFRNTISTNTNQDIMFPVWCGKLQLEGPKGQISPSTVISTPIWYPSLIKKCKRAFSNDYCTRTMLHGFDLMRRFERGFSFLLASVQGMSHKDTRILREIDGRRLNRSGGESTDSFYRMAIVRPERARDLLHRLTAFRAGMVGIDRDENPLTRANRMPLAQYERVVEQERNGQIYCLWEDSLEEGDDYDITAAELTNHIVELLTTQKSIQLLSNLPEYWHAGEWQEPPTMRWRRP
jgi:ubiquitin-conjugating enzyme E2 M